MPAAAVLTAKAPETDADAIPDPATLGKIAKPALMAKLDAPVAAAVGFSA
jgi:hypothetical protein